MRVCSVPRHIKTKFSLETFGGACVHNHGSLFNVFLATVKENNVENEMSGELPFSRLKMGDRKQGNP